MPIYHVTTANLQKGNVSVTEDSYADVTFPNAFDAAPDVVVSVEETEPEHLASVSNITTTGCRLHLSKPGGGPAGSETVHWVATCISSS